MHFHRSDHEWTTLNVGSKMCRACSLGGRKHSVTEDASYIHIL